MIRTITALQMLDELKRSDATVVVVNNEAEDREEAIENLLFDLQRGVVQPDEELDADLVVSYTFRIRLPILKEELDE